MAVNPPEPPPDKLMDRIRGSVRPIVTLQITTVFSLIVLRFLAGPIPAIPVEVIIGFIAAFTSTVATVIGFWFGQRGRSGQ